MLLKTKIKSSALNFLVIGWMVGEIAMLHAFPGPIIKLLVYSTIKSAWSSMSAPHWFQTSVSVAWSASTVIQS